MVFNEIAEQGQLSQILQRRLNMLGAAPAPALMPEIAPCLTLEQDRPEWGWPKGERLMSRLVSVAAVAAQFGAVQLYLPSTTRAIAVVTSVQLLNSTQTTLSRLQGIGGGLAGWAATVTCSRDFRWNANGSAVLVETLTNIAQPANNFGLAQLTSTAPEFRQPIVLGPGTALGIFGAAVNTALLLNVSWYERPALPGELV